MRLARLLRIAALLVLASLGHARAQGIEVAPVSVQLAPGQQTAILTVNNRSQTTATVQARPFAWRQSGDSEQLLPTEILAVSPPLTEIEGGHSQIIRIVLRRPAETQEETFRVLLDQLPPPATPGVVRIALRVSLPVFSAPPVEAVARLEWRVVLAPGGARLLVHNLGKSHARILSVSIAAAGGALPVRTVQAPYVLAGSERSWPFPAGGRLRPGTSVRLTATSDLGPIEANAPVGGGP